MNYIWVQNCCPIKAKDMNVHIDLQKEADQDKGEGIDSYKEKNLDKSKD